MDLVDKKAYIINAVEKFSARSIDVSGKGANLKRLSHVSESKTEELYKRVLELEKQGKTEKDKRQKKADAPQKSMPNFLSLQDKIQEIQTTIDVLVYKVAQLEAQLESLSCDRTKPQAKQAKQEVLGFRLVQKWVSSGGKRYLKWYGIQQREGSQVWVYVGDNAEKAEQKIKEWLVEHSK